VHPVTAVQMEYSLMSRSIEARVLPVCRELGIGVTAYGVLSRGLLAGTVPAGGYAGRRDFRAHAPRFAGDNLARNQRLVEHLGELARAHNATAAQLAVAWALARGTDVIPLVGARRRDRLAESLAALSLALTPAELAAIDEAVPAAAVAGERYDEHGMRMLDSERG
jgi:aryl-alcohol dehydrogenase-like predicted oxidoreductase